MTDSSRDIGSLLGEEASFNGKLSFFGTVRIEGHFEGEVVSDGTLVVAPGGLVRGKVDVGTLVVTGGRVEAEVTGRDSVELLSGGELSGEVTTPSFQIAKGAVFKGTSHMSSEPITDKEENEGDD